MCVQLIYRKFFTAGGVLPIRKTNWSSSDTDLRTVHVGSHAILV